MKETFQIELSFEDVLERQNEIHEMSRSKVSKLFSNIKVVAAAFGAIFLGYSLLVNREATLTIGEKDFSTLAYLFFGLVAGLVGSVFGCVFYALNQITLTAAKKKEAKRYIQAGENQYRLHLEGETLRIEKSKSEEMLIHLKEVWTALSKPRFILLRLGEQKAAILPRFPEKDFDLWEHINPLLKTESEQARAGNG